MIDEPGMIQRVTDTFVRQSGRLYKHVPKFPHVHKRFLANTVELTRFRPGPARPGLVFGYGGVLLDKIDDGLKRLRACLVSASRARN